MNTFARILSLIVACLLAPLTVFAIGDWIGAGLRFPLFLYQETIYGASLIPVWREISYVTSGIIGGRSALSILAWALGTALLLVAAGYLIYSRGDGITAIRKPLALLIASSALAYLISCILQYGPLLYGPAGFAIPVGVPLILAVAGYVLKVEDEETEDELDDDGEPGEDDGEEIERDGYGVE